MLTGHMGISPCRSVRGTSQVAPMDIREARTAVHTLSVQVAAIARRIRISMFRAWPSP
jgi:hypothetical protein